MWGNSLGWLLSAIVLVLVTSVGMLIYNASQITGATDLSSEANLQPLMSISPDIVRQDKPGDAGPDYRNAIKLFDAEQAQQFIMHKAVGTPPAAIQLVLDATYKSDMNLFNQDPSDLINYRPRNESLVTLGELGGDVVKCGIALLKDKDHPDPAAAKIYLNASFALGYKLYRERLCFDEYLVAERLLANSEQYLVDCQPQGSQEQQLIKDQLSALNEDGNRVELIREALSNINLSDMDTHAGDFYRFAGRAKDPMIRVEGILALGRLRFNASRPADQQNALRTIKTYLASENPAIATAAAAAASLTVEVYRMQH